MTESDFISLGKFKKRLCLRVDVRTERQYTKVKAALRTSSSLELSIASSYLKIPAVKNTQQNIPLNFTQRRCRKK